jgi:7,8-dihydro-6-hydroxymethylpterin dimethyltransferase
VVRTALATPYVGGVSIQPQFGSGRCAPIDPDSRLTHTGVLARLGPQTGGLVSWRDLTALPCSHPHCCSVGYLIRDDAGRWRSLVALIGHERLRAHLGLVATASGALPGRHRALCRLLGKLPQEDHRQLDGVGKRKLAAEVIDFCPSGCRISAGVPDSAGASGALPPLGRPRSHALMCVRV